MRILIGVLYTIENEYQECIDAIKKQTYSDFDYFVIENLPNKEAHEKLYSSFMNSAHKYDLFMKIDADMVLVREDFFEKVVIEFKADSKLDHYETYVHDFFTNRLIGALHTYRNTVTWNQNDDNLFIDRYAQIKHTFLDTDYLAPAAWHCPNPSSFQAFHFGVHKIVKAIQFGVEKSYGPACEHWENYELTKDNFIRTGNKIIGYAVLGAEIALKKRFASNEIDYNNESLLKEYRKFENLTSEKLAFHISSFSISSLNFLPSKLRHDLFLRMESKKLASFRNLPLLRYFIKMVYYHSKMYLIKNLK